MLFESTVFNHLNIKINLNYIVLPRSKHGLRYKNKSVNSV